MRVDLIVAIDETDIFAASSLKTIVPGGRLASVFLMNDLDAAVFAGVAIGDLAGIVSGAVVDEDDFEILVGLVCD